jgi:hypothetical protein
MVGPTCERSPVRSFQFSASKVGRVIIEAHVRLEWCTQTIDSELRRSAKT